MSTSFAHVVITRFNIKMPWHYSHDKSLRPIQTDTWMASRFDLFIKYCLPSLVLQSCKEFKWLIYFDIETALSYQERLCEIQSKYSFIKIFYVKDLEDMKMSISDNIRNLFNHDFSYLISTRIDNDDCFHRNAIERIQQEFENAIKLNELKNQTDYTNVFFINFFPGYCLQITPKYVLSTHQHKSNPFMSMIERADNSKNFSTIISFNHNNILDMSASLIQIDDGRYWLQIIHQSNLSNELQGFPSFQIRALTDFGIDVSIMRLNTLYSLSTICKKIIGKVFKLVEARNKISSKNFFSKLLSR